MDESTLLSSTSRDLADTLTALRRRYTRATFRFVGDRPESLRIAAEDSRLFGTELYLAEWSYPCAVEGQEGLIPPRVRHIESGRLQSVFNVPGNSGFMM